MPYVSKHDRERLDAGADPVSPGQLNYLISKLINKYLPCTPSYFAFNDVIGALECAKMEVYRRLVVPYEQEKMMMNGDVYTRGLMLTQGPPPPVASIKDIADDKSTSGHSDGGPSKGEGQHPASLECRAIEAT